MSVWAFEGGRAAISRVKFNVLTGVYDCFRFDSLFVRPVRTICKEGLDLSWIFHKAQILIGRIPAYESAIAVCGYVKVEPATMVRKNVKVERCGVFGV